MEAFYDEYNLIRVESDEHGEKFFIWDKEQISELYIEREFSIGNKVIYELSSLFELKVSKDYFIYTETGMKCSLQVRNYTRSAHFEEKYYYDGILGNIYTPTETTFRLWAPTCSDVLVKLIKRSEKVKSTHSLKRKQHGLWEVTLPGDFAGYSYVYVVKNQGGWKETVDPYAKASKSNGIESYVVNPERLRINSCSYKNGHLPITDSIIYELHVRDFSVDPNMKFKHKAKLLAFTEHGLTTENGKPIGIDYLLDLGITHVQLLPINDFASITEFDFDKAYNWGYDPEQFQVIDGHYATNPDDPYNRIIELKRTIETLHRNNIGVIIDVVYNHVFDAGSFSFEKIIPGYFFRKDVNNNYINGTGVGNDIASERKMVRKYIVDSLIYWLTEFNVQGFRFDLMGIIDIDTMLHIDETLRQINPNVYLYGEGWNMPTSLLDEKKTSVENAHYTPNIGYFNPTFRDIIKGSTFNHYERGLASGNTNLIGASEKLLRGSTDFMFLSPSQSINYVSCHDNNTLYDRFKLSCSGDVLNYQKLAFGFLLLSQGVPFIHAGSEFSRSKKGVENSYNSSDEINMIDWQLVEANQNLVNFVKGLIKLRKKYKEFRLDSKEDIDRIVHTEQDGHLIKYVIRGENCLKVVFNVSPYQIESNLNGEWREIAIEDNLIEISPVTTINAYSLRIYREI